VNAAAPVLVAAIGAVGTSASAAVGLYQAKRRIHVSRAPSPFQRVLAVIALTTVIAAMWKDFLFFCIGSPEVGHDLGLGIYGLLWAEATYAMTAGAGVVLLRRSDHATALLMGGLFVWGAASLVTGLAHSSAVLLAGRAFEGAGSALIASQCVRWLDRAGLLTARRSVLDAAMLTSAALGPLLAGMILWASSWHWLFLINVPIAILAVLVVLAFPSTRAADHLDRVGISDALAFVGGLSIGVTVVLAIVDGPILVGAASGGLCAIVGCSAFVRSRKRHEHRFHLTPELLRPRLVVLIVAGSVMQAARTSVLLIAVAYMTSTLGHGPLTVGLMILPFALIAGLGQPVVDRLGVERYHGTWLFVSCLLTAVSAGVMAPLPVHGNYVTNVLAALILLGLGTIVGGRAESQVAVGLYPRQDVSRVITLVSGIRIVAGSLLAPLLVWIVAPSLRTTTDDGLWHGLAGSHDVLLAWSAAAFIAGFSTLTLGAFAQSKNERESDSTPAHLPEPEAALPIAG
jgi:MFS family permease